MRKILCTLSIVGFFMGGFLFSSCGKKEKANTAQYGPLVAINPVRPSIQIQNCIWGEQIVCKGNFTYNNTGITSELDTGAFCTNSTLQDIVFELAACEDAIATSWSGSVTCTGTRSKFTPIQPLSLKDIAC